MIKPALLLTLIVTALASMPAHAQQRVYVSGQGLDTNPCTVTQPCRTFQQAYNTAPANAVIDVLDPAGYGPPFTITHGISIQGHGWASITQAASCPTCAAITISVTTGDPVTLNGLLIDGGGTGGVGIFIRSGPSVQILNSVVRQFQEGINNSGTNVGATMLIESTTVSDNANNAIVLTPSNIGSIKATLNRVTAANGGAGVAALNSVDTMIANSVLSNNTFGLEVSGSVTSLAKTVISGNQVGVELATGTVKSYGDNYLNDNMTPVSGGSLTPVMMQ
jgi:hypothetical protein